MHAFLQILLVGIGSALGGITRWGVNILFAHWLGTAFPWGTLVINISGSLFLGWFFTFLAGRMELPNTALLRPEDLKLLVAVGFTGAYTTFSTFEYETHSLLGEGEWLPAAAYVALSVFFGLAAVRLGVVLGRSF